MAVSTQSFQSMVSNAVSAMQGAASALVDLTVGSVLRAFVDAYCGLALWLQGLALQIASLTRFATSNGPDADSWGADFLFTRLNAVQASGVVTFQRFTPTQQAVIQAAVQIGTTSTGLPIWSGGQVVQTGDGTQQFQVVPDTTQAAYNVGLNLYVIPASTASADAAVQAINTGPGGNVAPGLVSVIASSIIGVDIVSNAAAMAGGADAESDAAYKARFPLYLQSLTQGTKQACINAVIALQEGATCNIVENFNISGFPQPGYFYAIVDDGTGDPSDAFLTAAFNAIQRVDAIGTPFGVFRPTIITANVSMIVGIAPGFTGSTVRAQIVIAVTAYVNSLSEGATLAFTKLFELAYDVPGVASVPLATTFLNGLQVDLVSTGQQLIRIGSVTVG